MNKDEIMTCAATLAAGVMSNRSGRVEYDADEAVDLMLQIAETIRRKAAEPEREYRQL